MIENSDASIPIDEIVHEPYEEMFICLSHSLWTSLINSEALGFIHHIEETNDSALLLSLIHSLSTIIFN
jgi:hypothetical protein